MPHLGPNGADLEEVVSKIIQTKRGVSSPTPRLFSARADEPSERLLFALSGQIDSDTQILAQLS